MSDAKPAQLAKMHAMARQLMDHYLGHVPRRIEHQASGLSNFVFLVKDRSEEFVVRIAPDPAKFDAFIKEQWAVQRVRHKGVPTPKILEVGRAIIPLPYMITRRVQGHEATHHPRRLEILEELAAYAAKINSIPTHDFGGVFDWANEERLRHTTWRAFLERELCLHDRLEVLQRHGGLSRSKARTLRRILLEAGGKRVRPRLNHGDLRLKNVIVDDGGTISAILDWENCTSNLAPQWELSLALHDLSIDEAQVFLRGYGLEPREVRQLAPAIKALNLINYAPEVARLAREKDRAGLAAYRLRLAGVLDLYSL